jgi:DNA-dependent metalloprotease WSS1
MAPNIRTLSSLGGHSESSGHGATPSLRPSASAASSSDYASTQGASNNNTSTKHNLPFKFCCIPKLPNTSQAESLLLGVVREFQPIIASRGYNVASISEMCCCNDGLDFEPTASAGARRKRRIMSSNIWGYNQTTFRGGNQKSHTIHIRLRHPTDHARLLPYEDVAGTLAHELSHCEFGPHNDKFYKLMDEILDEHASLMASQLRQGGAPMAAFSGAGYTVGSAAFTGTGHRLGSGGSGGFGGNKRTSAPHPRELRGHTLGGDSTFTVWMTPAEAAVAAAEARRRQQQLRLRGDHCCRPCTIDLTVSKDELDELQILAMEGYPDSAENEAPSSKAVAVASLDYIDLTEEDAEVLQEWSCNRCTFRNRPLALACDMCSTERTLSS